MEIIMIYKDIDINIINLQHRKDKWEHISNIFKDFNIKRFEAVYTNDGWKGCTLSHIEIIKNAKKENKNYVIVSEDDTDFFNSNWKKIFVDIIEYLKQHINDWDIFMFGCTYSNKRPNQNVKIVNDKLNIIEYEYGNTTNFMVYNQSIYDLVIKHENELNHPLDVIDAYLNKQNIIKWTVLPFLSYQINAYSDIQKRNAIEYKDLFIQNEKYLKNKLKYDKNT